MPRWSGWRAAALLAVGALVLGVAQAAAIRPDTAGPGPEGPDPTPAHAAADPAATCRDLRAGAMVACLHGNDVPPPGVDLFERPTLQELEARSSLASPSPRLRGLAGLEQATGEAVADEPPTLPCIGDGTSGKRIQAIYARAAGQTDAYNAVLASLRQWAVEIDQAVWASAGQTGDGRRLRFVTDDACQLDVDRVRLSPLGDDSFAQMRTELVALGYNRSDRKYLVWMDAAVGICGLGEVYGDTRPSPADNYNNRGPMYARVDRPCWQYAELHEIFHMLGAVQPDAPHPSAARHCTDDADVMCYDDGVGRGAMLAICPPEHEALLDCGDDDYFNTDPPDGSYLARAWNTADSGFLYDDGAAAPARLALTGAATITWGGRVGPVRPAHRPGDRGRAGRRPGQPDRPPGRRRRRPGRRHRHQRRRRRGQLHRDPGGHHRLPGQLPRLGQPRHRRQPPGPGHRPSPADGPPPGQDDQPRPVGHGHRQGQPQPPRPARLPGAPREGQLEGGGLGRPDQRQRLDPAGHAVPPGPPDLPGQEARRQRPRQRGRPHLTVTVR